jgi:hypothetical protein
MITASASTVLGFIGEEWHVLALSVMAAALSLLTFLHCSDSVSVFAMMSSFTILMSAIILTTVASETALVVNGSLSELSWIYLSSAVRGVATVPLILVFLFVFAAVYKASFNWVTASGLSWMIGLGLLVPQCMSLLIFETELLQDWVISNVEIIRGMIVNGVIFIIFSAALCLVFKKKRYIICENGLEVSK